MKISFTHRGPITKAFYKEYSLFLAFMKNKDIRVLTVTAKKSKHPQLKDPFSEFRAPMSECDAWEPLESVTFVPQGAEEKDSV